MNSIIRDRMGFGDSGGNGNGSGTGVVPAHARDLLNLRRLPGMLTAAQTAVLLDCGGEHNIPILIAAGLLTPLGDPPPNAVKYFATVTILEDLGDVKLLGRMRNVMYRHWQGKNAARSRAN